MMRETRTLGFAAANESLPSDPDVESVGGLHHISKVDGDKRLEEEIQRYKAEQEELLKEELAAKRKEKLSHIEDELNRLKVLNLEFEDLILEVTGAFKEKIATHISDTSSVVVSLVIEALMKIAGDEAINKIIVEQVVSQLIERKSSDVAAKLKVSFHDYKLLETLDCYEQVKPLVHTDPNLSAGEMALEDGLSLYKVGLLDRLDVLRVELISALERHHGL